MPHGCREMTPPGKGLGSPLMSLQQMSPSYLGPRFSAELLASRAAGLPPALTAGSFNGSYQGKAIKWQRQIDRLPYLEIGRISDGAYGGGWHRKT